MKITFEDMKMFLAEAGLENAGAGVVFPWGVKIVEINGKKMLQPMTPKEYGQAVHEETGRNLTKEEISAPRCVYASATCIPQGCNEVDGTCSLHHDVNGFYCLCSY